MVLSSHDITPFVGANLRRVRHARRLSLSGLAEISGVSRAMLSQVERGKSAPTINVMWRIARGLGIPFSTFLSNDRETEAVVLRSASAKVLTSRDGRFSSRALFPLGGPKRVEFYELQLSPHSVERAEGYPPGTQENLAVASGALTLVIAGRREHLDTGDAILFSADSVHEYRNEGDDPVRAYLVMSYEGCVPRALHSLVGA
jgi:transcriptional regulator with XRE-family HTH domain